MGLDDDSLIDLEKALLENPQVGDVIEGTGGARKMRIQLSGHGNEVAAELFILMFLNERICTCCSHILRMCRMT